MAIVTPGWPAAEAGITTGTYLTPPSCAVRGVPWRYRGETALLVFQNLHRYTLYGALLLLVFLWWEGLGAFFRDGRFGIGVGTVIMLTNASLLTGDTFGCHSWRHLIGGLVGLNHPIGG